jgi:hypothetical protein
MIYRSRFYFKKEMKFLYFQTNCIFVPESRTITSQCRSCCKIACNQVKLHIGIVGQRNNKDSNSHAIPHFQVLRLKPTLNDGRERENQIINSTTNGIRKRNMTIMPKR